MTETAARAIKGLVGGGFVSLDTRLNLPLVFKSGPTERPRCETGILPKLVGNLIQYGRIAAQAVKQSRAVF
jgi:hypothetical protein